MDAKMNRTRMKGDTVLGTCVMYVTYVVDHDGDLVANVTGKSGTDNLSKDFKEKSIRKKQP